MQSNQPDSTLKMGACGRQIKFVDVSHMKNKGIETHTDTSSRFNSPSRGPQLQTHPGVRGDSRRSDAPSAHLPAQLPAQLPRTLSYSPTSISPPPISPPVYIAGGRGGEVEVEEEWKMERDKMLKEIQKLQQSHVALQQELRYGCGSMSLFCLMHA